MASPRTKSVAAAGILVLVLILAPLVGPRAQEGTGAFLGGVEDLPLMAGLTEVADARVVFDKPAGRIVEAFAVGEVDAAAVRAFYATVLPQLGWAQVAGQIFQREDEILKIDIDAEGASVTVRFSISPQ